MKEKQTVTKFLIALPSFRDIKGFNCPTILVSAKNEVEALNLVKHLKPYDNIGSIKKVNY